MMYQCLENQLDELTGQVVPHLIEKSVSDLNHGEVQIKSHYSSINYKDALAATNAKSGVIRHYPLVGGIDVSGEVIASKNASFAIGDKVVVTGYGLGVSHPGGYSEVVTVPGDWVTILPENLSTKEAMVYGTAGITAALSVDGLIKHGLADSGARILVTGATGGVGSLAVGMLHRLGFNNITALSRKKGKADTYLKKIGCQHITTLAEITPERISPLMKQNFDFVLDTVGGEQLSLLLPQINYGGTITLCGNAAGVKFNTTVLPFILRGITILGIDSVNISSERRVDLWNKMATTMKPQALEDFIQETTTLENLPKNFQQLMDGKMTGRYLVKIS